MFLTYNHATWLPLSRTELLIRLINHQVQEDVKTSEYARDFPFALQVNKAPAVHELCACQLSHYSDT